jgi:hypothetical protein
MEVQPISARLLSSTRELHLAKHSNYISFLAVGQDISDMSRRYLIKNTFF